MTTKRDKKPWGRPNLIVLSRGESTESVLRACKYTGNVISRRIIRPIGVTRILFAPLGVTSTGALDL